MMDDNEFLDKCEEAIRLGRRHFDDDGNYRGGPCIHKLLDELLFEIRTRRVALRGLRRANPLSFAEVSCGG